MIVAVVSDTHGNRNFYEPALDLIAQRHGPDCWIHLGDDFADAEAMRLAGKTVHAVPGTRCPEYFEAGTPNRWIRDLDGILVAAAHVIDEVHPLASRAQLIMYGHTHRASLEHQGDQVWLNPGHLRSRNDRGELPSYAVVNLGPTAVAIRVYESGGQVRLETAFPRPHERPLPESL